MTSISAIRDSAMELIESFSDEHSRKEKLSELVELSNEVIVDNEYFVDCYHDHIRSYVRYNGEDAEYAEFYLSQARLSTLAVQATSNEGVETLEMVVDYFQRMNVSLGEMTSVLQEHLQKLEASLASSEALYKRTELI